MSQELAAPDTGRQLDRWLPPVLALIVSLLVLPVGYMLTHPFWLDEAWVAVGTRAPLAYMRAIAFPGPIAHALLMRIPTPGEQGMRLFTLAFSVAAVYAAYLFGRDLGWENRRQGIVVGGMAALAVVVNPWSLVRVDLKHYTAEAFMALLLLWLAGRVEDGWDRRRLITLGALAAVFSVFGWTSMFVSVGVFIGLCVVAVVRRGWPAVRDIVVTGGLLAAVFVAVWGFFLRPFSSTMSNFWGFAFLDGGPVDVARQTWWRFSDLMNYYPSNARYVGPPLFVLGLVVIFRRKPATAVGVVTTGVVALALGWLNMFPFLERRTSHYLLIMFIAVVGVGLGWIAVMALKRMPTLGVFVTTGLAALLIWGGMPWFQNHSLAPLRTSGHRSNTCWPNGSKAM